MSTAFQKKVERIPRQGTQGQEQEPRFPEPDERWVAPAWGPYEHTEDDLRMMWPRIWQRFKSRRLCEGYLQHHKKHSIDTWCSAFEYIRQSKEGEFSSIEYVMKVAGSYEVSETPNQRSEREAREQQERLAMKSMGTKEAYTPSQKVREYWAEKSRTRSIEDIPSDHPDVIRMMKKLKGDGRK